MQAETGVAWPQSQECHRTPEAGLGKEWALPQGLQRRCGPANFQPLAFCEWINFHCFKSPSCGNLLQRPQETNIEVTKNLVACYQHLPLRGKKVWMTKTALYVLSPMHAPTPV